MCQIARDGYVEPMMHISCVISSMACGGAERVLSILANHFAGTGHQVQIVSFASADLDYFALVPAVERVVLEVPRRRGGVGGGFCSNAQRISALRSHLRIERPDVVLSFMPETNVVTIVAATGLGIPVAVSERTDPHALVTVGRAWRIARYVLYRRAATVIVQSQRAARWALAIPGVGRVDVLPNPVGSRAPGLASNDAARRDSSRVVAIGRFSAEKRFDLLVRAFRLVAASNQDARLYIFGDGPLRAELEQLVRVCQLEGRVLLPGRTKTPEAELARSRIFVLCSSFEGFPNALVEAMGAGCAVVSTKYSEALDEILSNNVEGIIVDCTGEPEQRLAQAMLRLLSDDSLCAELGARAAQRADDFAPSRVVPQWLAVLENVSRPAHARAAGPARSG